MFVLVSLWDGQKCRFSCSKRRCWFPQKLSKIMFFSQRQVGATRFGRGVARGWPRSAHSRWFLNHFSCFLAFIFPFEVLSGLIFMSERPRNHSKMGPKWCFEGAYVNTRETFKNCIPPTRKPNLWFFKAFKNPSCVQNQAETHTNQMMNIIATFSHNYYANPGNNMCMSSQPMQVKSPA